MNTLIVFFIGRSTIFPGPTVQGPPMIVINLVLILVRDTVLIAASNADPVALFYLNYLALWYESD